MRARTGAALLACIVLLGGCGWFGPPHQPDVAPGPALVDAPYLCPTLGDHDIATPGASTLPTGAVAARLCVAGRPGPFVPPYDDLTSHLDRLVRLVDRQRITGAVAPIPERWKNSGCSGPTPPPFAIVLRYAGGTRTIVGNPVPCRGQDLWVGNAVRADSMRIWHTYLRLLDDQRRRRGVPTGPTTIPTCQRAEVVSPTFVARRLVAARFCARDHRGRLLVGGSVPLSPTQLRVVRHDLVTRSDRSTTVVHPPCRHWPQEADFEIVGVDAWSDRAVVHGACDLLDVGRAVESWGPDSFRPRSSTTRMIVGLLRAAGR